MPFTERDDVLVEDQDGELTYEEAVSHTVDTFVAKFEALLWELVDEIEYLGEEGLEDGMDPEDDTRGNKR